MQEKNKYTGVMVRFEADHMEILKNYADSEERPVAFIVRKAVLKFLNEKNAEGTNRPLLSSSRPSHRLGKGISRKPKKTSERLVG